MGPEALRVAGLQAALEARGLEVFDLGNLTGPANPWLPPENGYRHLSQVEYWNRAVHEAVFANCVWTGCRSCWAVITRSASGRSVQWRVIAVKRAESYVCCGSMHTRTSIRASSLRAAIFTACLWHVCAASDRLSSLGSAVPRVRAAP